jgi:imidazolonepropionase-like amidohydrolase
VYEANAWRSYVMAHAHTSDAVRRSAELGIRSIEHATLMDEDTARFIASGTSYVVPTLAIANAIVRDASTLGLVPAVLDKVKEFQRHTFSGFEAGHRASLRMGFGTDLLGVLHAHQSTEFELRRDIQTPLEILQSATIVNAEIMQQQGLLGEITVGAWGDVLLFNRDPLRDISVLAQPEKSLDVVIKAGRVAHERDS